MRLLKIKQNKYMYIFLLSIFIVEIIPIFYIKSLTVDTSEYNIIAMAAGMTGINWKDTINSKYYYGYLTSVLYSIVFLFRPLISHPIWLFRSFLFINSLLNVFCSYFLYKMLRLVNNNKIGESYIAGISFLTSLFISKIVLSKMATNENLYVLFYYIAIYLIVSNIESNTNKQIKSSFIIGMVSIGAYANNNRGIVLIIMVLMTYIIIYLFRKERIVYITAFLVSLVITYIIHILLKEFMISNFFAGEDATKLINNDSGQIVQNLFKLMNPRGVKILLMGIIGWSYYFIVSTYGIGTIAVLTCMNIIKNLVYDKEKKYTNAEYTLSVMSLLFLVGAVILGGLFYYNSFHDMFHNLDTRIGTNRVDKLIYGRYISTIKPIIIAFSLSILFKYKVKFKNLAMISLVSTVGIVLLFHKFIAVRMNGKQYAASDINEFAVFLGNFMSNPKFGVVDSSKFYYTSVAVIVLTLITIFLIFYNKLRVYLLCISIIGLIFYLMAVKICVIPKAEYYYQSVNHEEVNIINCADSERVYIEEILDASHIAYTDKIAHLYQFNCAKKHVIPLRDNIMEVYTNSLIQAKDISVYVNIKGKIYNIAGTDLYIVGTDLYEIFSKSSKYKLIEIQKSNC